MYVYTYTYQIDDETFITTTIIFATGHLGVNLPQTYV